MNADARHGGLRPKRCLPAKFHPKTAHHYRLNSKLGTTPVPNHASSFPKSARTIVTASKRANSRFFTNCYPISAVFTPTANPIAPRFDVALALLSGFAEHNYSLIISCLARAPANLLGPKTKVPAARAGTFFRRPPVTNFRWLGAAETPGYPNDRRPVAARQHVPG